MSIRLFRHYVPVPLLLLAVAEALILFSSMFIGVALRFVSINVGKIESVGAIFPKAVVFTCVMFGIMTAAGLYHRDTREEGKTGYFIRFLGSFVAGLIAMVIIFYAAPGLYLGRGAFGLAFLFALTGTAIVRFLAMNLFHHEVLQRRVMLLGSGSRSANVAALERDENGKRKYNLVGCLPLTNADCHFNKARILQDPGHILAVAKKYKVDEIVIGVRERRNGTLPTEQLLECKLAGIDVVDLSSFFEREMGQIQIESLNPSWMIFSDGFRHGSVKDLSKRAFDILAGGILFFMTLPVMVLMALLIGLESGRPIFYRQERVGQLGSTFELLKFRSMRRDAEQDGVPRWAKKDDDRTTRVGRVMRKLRIDELPQIFNVLKGNMSFVGPRPERPYFVNELSQRIPFYSCRHAVKPGITGWSQIRYSYGASVEDAVKKLQYDLYYVKNHSLFLDMIILIQTVQVVLFGKGAR